MKITVIDGQGGSLGKELISALISQVKDIEITAVGTNSTATAAMLKAGAHIGATGQNAVKVACADADVISGPIGILCADAIHGEITPAMAYNIGKSRAHKVLIPVNRCSVSIAGVTDKRLGDCIKDAVDIIRSIAECADISCDGKK